MGGSIEVELDDAQMESVYRERLKVYEKENIDCSLAIYAEGYHVPVDDLFSSDMEKDAFYGHAMAEFHDRKDMNLPDATVLADVVSDSVDEVLVPTWKAKLAATCINLDTFHDMLQLVTDMSGGTQVGRFEEKAKYFEDLPTCYVIALMAKFIWKPVDEEG